MLGLIVILLYWVLLYFLIYSAFLFSQGPHGVYGSRCNSLIYIGICCAVPFLYVYIYNLLAATTLRVHPAETRLTVYRRLYMWISLGFLYRVGALYLLVAFIFSILCLFSLRFGKHVRFDVVTVQWGTAASFC